MPGGESPRRTTTNVPNRGYRCNNKSARRSTKFTLCTRFTAISPKRFYRIETMNISTTVTIRDALLDDAPTIVDFNCRLAWETEHKRLDPAVIGPGVEAALRRPEFARYFLAEMNGEIVGQMML